MSGVADEDLASFWTPPAPRELPAVRSALAEHMRSPYQLELSARVLAAGKGALVPAGAPRQAAATLLADEGQRLRAADLYYVAEEMSELARVAGESLPRFTLDVEDLPSPGGFIQFASSIGSYVSDEDGGLPRRIHIVACSWGRTTLRTGHEGVWVTFWCPTNRSGLVERFVREDGLRRTDAERIVRAMGAELTWDNEAFLPFGTDGLALVDRNRRVAGGGLGATGRSTTPWIQSLRAGWLLISQQGIADVERQRLSRQQQRRAVREGCPFGDVQVVRLRGRSGPGKSAGADDSGYSVRWMVRGHWRHQAYGAQRGLRRPVWVKPHLKGPSDAPLSIREKVLLIDRPNPRESQ